MGFNMGIKKATTPPITPPPVPATLPPKRLLVVATMMVRNEEDILEESLRHLLDQGVHRIIVTDNASDDDSRKIAASFPEVTIIDEPDHTYQQVKWQSRMGQMAFEMGAAWVVPNDADEFWEGIPNLHLVPPQFNAVLAHCVYNHPATNAITKPFKRSQMPYFLVAPDRNFGDWGCGRFCYRPFDGVQIDMGQHGIGDWKNRGVQIGVLNALWQHHYPIRSYEHYEKKVKISAEALTAGNLTQYGNHAFAAYKLWQLGKLRESYDAGVVCIK